jgi:osmotically-inducible protein OsmY
MKLSPFILATSLIIVSQTMDAATYLAMVSEADLELVGAGEKKRDTYQRYNSSQGRNANDQRGNQRNNNSSYRRDDNFYYNNPNGNRNQYYYQQPSNSNQPYVNPNSNQYYYENSSQGQVSINDLGSDQDRAPSDEDRDTLNRISHALEGKDDSRRFSNAHVNILNGQVTMSGTVDTEIDHQSIINKIKDIKGVTGITDTLEVKYPPAKLISNPVR